ncbi:MAG TPA: hypothetical protein VG929_12335 [Actinomycetota bacterium]|nr:hypothetical protein [Actinomycetota bacterium]
MKVMLGGGLLKRLRGVAGHPILVVAPYISPRSRELLVDEGANFLDLTGNLRLVLNNPAVFVETRGADQDPAEKPRRKTGLRGANVGGVARVLIDVRPPYGTTEIATAARVSPGYVTKILETLSAEALIERGGTRGPVTDVDWQALVRRRAEALDLLASNTTSLYVAPNGARGLLDGLPNQPDEKLAVTGSFAAAEVAPIAAPALLALYTLSPNKDQLARRMGLLPTSEGGDIALVRPDNPNVFVNLVERQPIPRVAPSQVAIDSLSGNGRMPSEGEALIEWMADNESDWRLSSLDDVYWPPWIPR